MTDGNFQTELWQMQMQRNIPGLIAALRHQNPVIRRRAAVALRALGAGEALAPITRAFEQETDPETRAHLAAAMESLQSVAAQETPPDEAANPPQTSSELSRLMQQLKSETPETVIEAARQLAELNDKLAVEPLIFLFKAQNTPINVRLAVAEALLALDSAPVEVALLGALRSSEWRVRRNGAAILGKLKAEWAIQPLTKALSDTNGAVRLTAHAALRHIGTPAAREALASATDITGDETGETAATDAPLPANKDPMPRQKTPELDRIREETQPKRPTNPDGTPIKLKPDDTHKIAWPRHTRRRRAEKRHAAPTRPLNPDALEEAQARSRKVEAQRRSGGDSS